MQKKEKTTEEPLFEFENLEVYKRSEDYRNRIFDITENFPPYRYINLSSQLTRTALSISLNLAEGFGSHYKNQKKRYFRIVRGSVYECIPALRISLRQKLIQEDIFKDLYNECYELSRMISGLIKSIDKKSDPK